MIALTRRNPKLFKISDVYMPPTIRDYPSLLWSLAAGRQLKTNCAPQWEQVGRSAWPMPAILWFLVS